MLGLHDKMSSREDQTDLVIIEDASIKVQGFKGESSWKSIHTHNQNDQKHSW